MNKIQLIHCDDQTLVTYCQDGNERALDVLLKRHQNYLESVFRKIIADLDKVQDLVQETFIKVWNIFKKQGYHPTGSFKAWLGTIAKNFAIDAYRRKKRQSVVGLHSDLGVLNVIENSLNAEQRLVRREFNKFVWAHVDTLPEDLKEMVNLHFFAELSYPDMYADFKGIHTPSTIRNRVYRGLKLLERNEQLQKYR